MLKHKTAKKNLPVLKLYAKDGSILFEDRLDAFPFPEPVILAGCEEFFSDSNPCEIHRRALQLRLCAEMENALPANQRVSLDEVPDMIRLYCREIRPDFLEIEREDDEARPASPVKARK